MEKEDFLKKIGKNIVRLREKKGLRQIDLAIELDIDDSSLRRIESGRTNPTILTLKKIADVLEVNLSEIVDV
ncbi:helix-turn-helix domain-containing protein [Maribellus maritimus]|uniref:helix-turn-helix domain-containing protein n=1 Tax=Maribellus maritimus TaxID=2870838 RepID=UPI001EEC27A5|nr:helix-turn-helix transcriptional regulator [Maribellus maritimus]MCG6189112.1 helix-turn-helix domain-containing protein [Maribellus maritimus]